MVCRSCSQSTWLRNEILKFLIKHTSNELVNLYSGTLLIFLHLFEISHRLESRVRRNSLLYFGPKVLLTLAPPSWPPNRIQTFGREVYKESLRDFELHCDAKYFLSNERNGQKKFLKINWGYFQIIICNYILLKRFNKKPADKQLNTKHPTI